MAPVAQVAPAPDHPAAKPAKHINRPRLKRTGQPALAVKYCVEVGDKLTRSQGKREALRLGEIE